MTGNAYIEADFCQRSKHGELVSGDVFLMQRRKEEHRLIAVLSDGLGSGVKASVLATLTATMAMKYTAAFVDIRKSAETIMDTLPICKMRKISYSTFTIIDATEDGRIRGIEHGNPPFIHLRGTREERVPRETFKLERWQDRPLSHSLPRLELGDRLIFFSDGISQSGIGQSSMPLGWGVDQARQYASALVAREPQISARNLAHALVERACRNDGNKAKDDTTCAVLYYRRPRHVLIITGPPFNKSRDAELGEAALAFEGKKAICGGTTANIVSRTLGRPVELRLDQLDPEIPPASKMEGVDLITEGTLTLSRVANLLEASTSPELLPENAARELLTLLLESDVIHFLVGTRINDAHQDPNIPVELQLRRNLIKKMATLLEEKHFKETVVRMI